MIRRLVAPETYMSGSGAAAAYSDTVAVLFVWGPGCDSVADVFCLFYYVHGNITGLVVVNHIYCLIIIARIFDGNS